MKIIGRTESLDKIYNESGMIAGIDMIGNFKYLFKSSSRIPGYMFLLCIKGTCVVNVHLTQYTLKKNSLLILLPDLFFQVVEQSKDCRFIFAVYETDVVRSSNLFSKSIEYTPFIFENPVIHLSEKNSNLLYSYIYLLINVRHTSPDIINKEHATLSFTQLILGLGSVIRKQNKTSNQYNRNQEIIKGYSVNVPKIYNGI